MPASDHADVAIKPPFLFLGALALGCLLSLVLPIGPRLASPNGLALGVGVTFVAIGLALAVLSIRRFRLAGTSVVPGEPSTALVVEGPYRFTRNPIYIGFVLLYFGLAIILTSLWVLAAADPRADRLAARRGRARGGLISSGNSATPTANTRRACRAGSSSNIQLVGLGEFGALLDEAEARLGLVAHQLIDDACRCSCRPRRARPGAGCAPWGPWSSLSAAAAAFRPGP